MKIPFEKFAPSIYEIKEIMLSHTEIIRLRKALAESEEIFEKGKRITKICDPGMWVAIALLGISMVTPGWTLYYTGLSVWVLAFVPTIYGLSLIRKSCKILERELKLIYDKTRL